MISLSIQCKPSVETVIAGGCTVVSRASDPSALISRSENDYITAVNGNISTSTPLQKAVWECAPDGLKTRREPRINANKSSLFVSRFGGETIFNDCGRKR